MVFCRLAKLREPLPAQKYAVGGAVLEPGQHSIVSIERRDDWSLLVVGVSESYEVAPENVVWVVPLSPSVSSSSSSPVAPPPTLTPTPSSEPRLEQDSVADEKSSANEVKSSTDMAIRGREAPQAGSGLQAQPAQPVEPPWKAKSVRTKGNDRK